MVEPCHSGRAKYYRIRFSVVAVFLVVFLVGVAGFFVPFGHLALDAAEKNHKEHLATQNRKLLQRIRKMREMFLVIKHDIDTLDLERRKIGAIVDIDSVRPVADAADVDRLSRMDLSRLSAYASVTAAFYEDFAQRVSRHEFDLDAIPIVRPVTGEHVVTSCFGEKRDPFTGQRKMHHGMDFAAVRGMPVVATADGTVIGTENHHDWGRKVRIKHESGFMTVYAHLGSVKVGCGRRVKKGDVIGTIGTSGLATGPHVHYEVLHDGTHIDPETLFFPAPVVFDPQESRS